jgi:hypothetical protein
LACFGGLTFFARTSAQNFSIRFLVASRSALGCFRPGRVGGWRGLAVRKDWGGSLNSGWRY